MFSPCNPSLYDNEITRSRLPYRYFSFSILRTVQVRLLRLPVRQMILRGPLLDVLEVQHALLCYHGHRLFRHTPNDWVSLLENFGCDVEYHWDVQCRLLRTYYVSRAQDISLLISAPVLMANTCVT